MIVVLTLLFLPAAASGDYNSLARYWAGTATSVSTIGALRSYAVDYQRNKASKAQAFERRSLLSIRLASRSELFGCLVDGVGLLFLPAAGWYGNPNGVSRDWFGIWSTLAGVHRTGLGAVAVDCRAGSFLQVAVFQNSIGISVRLASR